MSRSPLARAALGRELTRLANGGARAALENLSHGPVHLARRIGVTGAPGAGKSTLVRHLVARSLAAGRRVGVLAVDPTSPYTRGAILGDRIRMGEVAEHPEFFFRSLASRSAHDGLADNLAQILSAMERHDFDELWVETVGVGQAEFGVRALVDCVVLVLVPEAGDQIQAMKAGIVEIADVIVVNKSDLPGAQKIATEVNDVVARRQRSEAARRPPVVLASQNDAASHAAIQRTIDAHFAWLDSREDEMARRHARAVHLLRSAVSQRLDEVLASLPAAALDRPLVELHREVLAQLAVEAEGDRHAALHSSSRRKPGSRAP